MANNCLGYRRESSFSLSLFAVSSKTQRWAHVLLNLCVSESPTRLVQRDAMVVIVELAGEERSSGRQIELMEHKSQGETLGQMKLI